MRYQWDFSKIKIVSFRKGGRIHVTRYDRSTFWVALEDQEEFKRQWNKHRATRTEEFLEKFE